MKISRLIVFLIAILFANTAWSDTVIQMEEFNGVYRIPCTVNGAKMKFIFDTGASNVCLSMSMAEYLYDNEYITKDDILGTGSSSVADGRIVDHVIINLKDIEIAGQHLHNVQAIVIDGQNAPLLMGQTAIQKLGRVQLNGNMLTLLDNELSSDAVINDDILFEKAWDYYNNERYSKAYEIYSKLHTESKLSDYGKFLFGRCCFETKHYSEGIHAMETIEEFDAEKYQMLATLNIRNGNREDAVYYYNKAYESTSDAFEKAVCLWFLGNAFAIGGGNMYKSDYTKGLEYYKAALSQLEAFYNFEKGYLFNIAINNKEEIEIFRIDSPYVDDLVYNIADLSWLTQEWSYTYATDIMQRLSKNGNKKAVQWLNRRDY